MQHASKIYAAYPDVTDCVSGDSRRIEPFDTALANEKRIAVIVRKLLASCVANARNNFKISGDNLVIARVDVGKSFVLKRSMPRGRGRGTRIEKRFSNLRIVLEEQKNVVDNKKVVKKVK